MKEYAVREAATGLPDTLYLGGDPEEGSSVEDRGKLYIVEGETLQSMRERGASPFSGVGVTVAVSDNFEAVTGWALPNDHPSIDACGIRRDASGNPVFSSREQIRRFNLDSKRRNERDHSVPAYGWDGSKE